MKDQEQIKKDLMFLILLVDRNQQSDDDELPISWLRFKSQWKIVKKLIESHIEWND